MKLAPSDPLENILATLPVEVTPPRNLWPAIAGRVGRIAPRGPSYLAAACIAVVAAGLASVVTWATLRHVGASTVLPAVAQHSPFGEPNDPRYVAAKSELEHTFRERLALLEPASRAQIEASLVVIRDAHETIRQALLEDPSSAVLGAIWQSSWRDEIDLYDHVVQVTDTAMTRS